MMIGKREIGGKQPPFVVAEISGNHCGYKENAIQLIKDAKRAGADAVKTQCYTADSMTLDCNKIDFIVQGGLWAGRSFYELYSDAHTPPEWHPDLYKAAEDAGIPIFSSVFDRREVDMLMKLNCPAFKIASFEITDVPLIEYVASTGRPMVLSTGLASNQEVLDAADIIHGKTHACFLHCTSEYPGTVEGAGMDRMLGLNSLLDFRFPVGVSDHTTDFIIPIVATARKAAIIEKHLKLAHMPSEDSEFSLDADDFGTMVETVKLVYSSLRFDPPKRAAESQFRRSLYAVADIGEGEQFSTENVRAIRPGFGKAPKHLHAMLGTPSPKAYKRGDPIR